MVKEKGVRVLSPLIDQDGCVQRVNVETQFDHVDYVDETTHWSMDRIICRVG